MSPAPSCLQISAKIDSTFLRVKDQSQKKTFPLPASTLSTNMESSEERQKNGSYTNLVMPFVEGGNIFSDLNLG
jgi:hypothetical protein